MDYVYLSLYVLFWVVVLPCVAIFCLGYIAYNFYLWADKKLGQQLEFLDE
jgi:hypothetical protein